MIVENENDDPVEEKKTLIQINLKGSVNSEWLPSLKRKLSSVICESVELVTSGMETSNDEFPWTALLEYRKRRRFLIPRK